MSVGKSRKYKILDIAGRHFVETGREAGLGPTIIREVITSVLEAAGTATDKVIAEIPGFACNGHTNMLVHMKI